jgi:hypothetical protein
LQVYGDVFAVLTIPVEVRSGRIYNQELNVWNWKTGEHLCVSIRISVFLFRYARRLQIRKPDIE